jgi:hypothetical protein
LVAASAGAVLQVALVALGHFVPFVADNLFAIGGVAIAFAAGILYARRSGVGRRPVVGGGAAGALSALVGIVASAILGDVPWMLLPFGLVAAFVAGLLGGTIGANVWAAETPSPSARR